MKRSRKLQKALAKRHLASQLARRSVSRADLQHLDAIATAVLDCERLDDEEVGARYRLIGDLLHSNVTRLDLDEDTLQLVDFAKRIAGELLSAKLRLWWFGSNSCWDKVAQSAETPWFALKIDGKNHGGDEYMLRAVADQKVAMVDIALTLLETDSRYRAGALALRRHQVDHELLPDKFSLRHDDV